MKQIVSLLAVIVLCCGYVTAAPATLVRRRRVSGNDNGVDMDENLLDYDYKEGDDTLYDDYEEYDHGTTFSCFEGNEEVPIELICDGVIDCTDGSDEVDSNCEDHGVSPTPTLSSTTSPKIIPGTKSVTSAAVEPSIRDLKDYGYDYEDACTDEEFQCTSDISICLPKSQVCDGVHDCPLKEDEASCAGSKQKVGIQNNHADSNWFDVSSLDLNGARQSVYDFTDYTQALPYQKTPTVETESNIQHGFRPIITLEKPPPEQPNVPIFASDVKQEKQQLGLEADYQYISWDDDNVQKDPLGNAQKQSPTDKRETSNDTTTNNFSSTSVEEDHEIEINHETGEITLVKNGIRTLLSPPKGNSQPSSKPQWRRKLGSTFHLTEHEKSTKSNGKHKKKRKLQGIIGQLLHHIGELVEEEDNLLHGNLNIEVGVGENLPQRNLYSRITSNAPNTHIRINLDLQL